LAAASCHLAPTARRHDLHRAMAPYSDITEPAIMALVHRFYTKARRDPLIGPVFNDAVEDWDEHLGKLCDFWSSVMLTTGRYKGNPMAVHMKLPIGPHFFARWLALWQETAGEVFAPEPAAAFRDKAGRIAESLKLGLFYRPGALFVARSGGARS
jgi:hemoglobin